MVASHRPVSPIRPRPYKRSANPTIEEKTDAMSSDDYKIVSDTNVELEGYSRNKVKQLKLLKNKIKHHNPYL